MHKITQLKAPRISFGGLLEGVSIITNKKLINDKAKAFYSAILFRGDEYAKHLQDWMDFSSSKNIPTNQQKKFPSIDKRIFEQESKV